VGVRRRANEKGVKQHVMSTTLGRACRQTPSCT
jgi:putative component of membrane protein insertase Oxa1/YidC/SpoIIIJ protein YidD